MATSEEDHRRKRIAGFEEFNGRESVEIARVSVVFHTEQSNFGLRRGCFRHSTNWSIYKINLEIIHYLTSVDGDAGDRTPCLSHAKRALYHLSYIPFGGNLKFIN